jgi:hypothetical protein
MAELNILERYGIKEVCDVTFYEIITDKDTGKIRPGKPVLYLDTLKVSTVEQTAENVAARGGKGNPELVVWDYGKEITLNLEDAVFSSKSLALMYGTSPKEADEEYGLLRKVLPKSQLTADGDNYKFTMHGQEYKVAAADIKWFTVSNNVDGEPMEKEVDSIEKADYAVFALKLKEHTQIDINSDTFPGTYYVTGDTYARSEADGQDEFLQLIIPKAKMLSEVTLTMEAEGDPSTFNMSMKVLRPTDKVMMKLIKYDVDGTGKATFYEKAEEDEEDGN